MVNPRKRGLIARSFREWLSALNIREAFTITREEGESHEEARIRFYMERAYEQGFKDALTEALMSTAKERFDGICGFEIVIPKEDIKTLLKVNDKTKYTDRSYPFLFHKVEGITEQQ